MREEGGDKYDQFKTSFASERRLDQHCLRYLLRWRRAFPRAKGRIHEIRPA